MICTCKKIAFNDFKNLSYWENKNITTDEDIIVKYLCKKILSNKKIFHVGVGNSSLASKLSKKKIKFIYGITIADSEISFANTLNIRNYKVKLLDKHNSNLSREIKKKFNIIVDNNLKSYSCCQKNFNNYFKSLTSLLENDGIILTTKKGMRWYKKLNIKKTFSLKKLFYNKIKETKGLSRNILSFGEIKYLSTIHSLKIVINKDLVIFKK